MNKKTLIIILVIVGVLLLIGLFIRRRRFKEEIPGEETAVTNYLVRLKKGCTPRLTEDFQELIVTPRFRFITVELTEQEKRVLQRDACVLKISTPAEARENFEKLPPEVQEAVKEKIKKYFLAKSLLKRDLVERKKLLEILRREQPELPEEITSYYQLYITPESPVVSQLASGKTPQELYQEAVSWIWVDEQTLNRQEEKWLKPEEFLKGTPSYPTNPLPGKTVSDCSEQANTLVSLMRASGVPAEQVRVVLGKVKFEEQIGGHSWVQIFKDGVWVDLDPTSGPYWDEEKQILVPAEGLPWYYFKFFPFPVIETWVYYNDVYFYDLETREGNKPVSWQ